MDPNEFANSENIIILPSISTLGIKVSYPEKVANSVNIRFVYGLIENLADSPQFTNLNSIHLQYKFDEGIAAITWLLLLEFEDNEKIPVICKYVQFDPNADYTDINKYNSRALDLEAMALSQEVDSSTDTNFSISRPQLIHHAQFIKNNKGFVYLLESFHPGTSLNEVIKSPRLELTKKIQLLEQYTSCYQFLLNFAIIGQIYIDANPGNILRNELEENTFSNNELTIIDWGGILVFEDDNLIGRGVPPEEAAYFNINDKMSFQNGIDVQRNIFIALVMRYALSIGKTTLQDIFTLGTDANFISHVLFENLLPHKNMFENRNNDIVNRVRLICDQCSELIIDSLQNSHNIDESRLLLSNLKKEVINLLGLLKEYE